MVVGSRQGRGQGVGDPLEELAHSFHGNEPCPRHEDQLYIQVILAILGIVQ